MLNGEFVSDDKRTDKNVSTKNYTLPFVRIFAKMICIARSQAYTDIAERISGTR